MLQLGSIEYAAQTIEEQTTEGLRERGIPLQPAEELLPAWSVSIEATNREVLGRTAAKRSVFQNPEQVSQNVLDELNVERKQARYNIRQADIDRHCVELITQYIVAEELEPGYVIEGDEPDFTLQLSLKQHLQIQLRAFKRTGAWLDYASEHLPGADLELENTTDRIAYDLQSPRLKSQFKAANEAADSLIGAGIVGKVLGFEPQNTSQGEMLYIEYVIRRWLRPQLFYPEHQPNQREIDLLPSKAISLFGERRRLPWTDLAQIMRNTAQKEFIKRTESTES